MIDTAKELDTALDLYKAGTTSLNGLWNFFSVVVLAIVGLVFGGKVALPGRGKLALVAAFLAFAIANNLALKQAEDFRIAAKTVVQNSIVEARSVSSAGYVAMLDQVDPASTAAVQLFQGCLAIGLVIGIWAQHRHDQRNPPV